MSVISALKVLSDNGHYKEYTFERYSDKMVHTGVIMPQDYIFQPKTSSNRFVAFFDILGFKSIVAEYPAQEVVDKIKNLLIPSLNQSVNSVWNADKVKYISVSDSIILYTVDDSEVSCMNMRKFKNGLVALLLQIV